MSHCSGGKSGPSQTGERGDHESRGRGSSLGEGGGFGPQGPLREKIEDSLPES